MDNRPIEVPMEVIIAKNSGFCFGVKRAVDIALNTTGKTSVLGELVHNRDVTQMLAKTGIETVKDVSEAQAGNIIIRSHGEADSVIEKARSRGLNVIDATCINVKRVQELSKELEKKGYRVIIFGKKEHAEVKGIYGNLKNAVVYENVKELEGTDISRSAIVFQTTQSDRIFEEVKRAVRKQKPLIFNTLCPVTSQREKDAVLLCQKVDIMIVIGGLHSSNTKELAKVCGEIVEVHHIENGKELKKEWFQEKKICGITAGASTPDFAINDVANTIRKY